MGKNMAMAKSPANPPGRAWWTSKLEFRVPGAQAGRDRGQWGGELAGNRTQDPRLKMVLITNKMNNLQYFLGFLNTPKYV
jgi:hypothetical protein